MAAVGAPSVAVRDRGNQEVRLPGGKLRRIGPQGGAAEVIGSRASLRERVPELHLDRRLAHQPLVLRQFGSQRAGAIGRVGPVADLPAPHRLSQGLPRLHPYAAASIRMADDDVEEGTAGWQQAEPQRLLL